MPTIGLFLNDRQPHDESCSRRPRPMTRDETVGRRTLVVVDG